MTAFVITFRYLGYVGVMLIKTAHLAFLMLRVYVSIHLHLGLMVSFLHWN